MPDTIDFVEEPGIDFISDEDAVRTAVEVPQAMTSTVSRSANIGLASQQASQEARQRKGNTLEAAFESVALPPGGTEGRERAAGGYGFSDSLLPIPKIPIREGESRFLTVGKEAANVLLGIPEFATSLPGLMAAPAAAAAPTLAAAGFTADMLHGLGKQVAETYGNWDQMTPTQKSKAVTDIAGTGILAGLTGHATVKGLRGVEPSAPSSVALADGPEVREIPAPTPPTAPPEEAAPQPTPETPAPAAPVAEEAPVAPNEAQPPPGAQAPPATVAAPDPEPQAVPVTENPATPAAPAAKQYQGKTLDEWFSTKDVSELPKGNDRLAFARMIGAENKPSAILRALKNDQARIRRRIDEIEKPFQPEVAQVDAPAEPMGAAPSVEQRTPVDETKATSAETKAEPEAAKSGAPKVGDVIDAFGAVKGPSLTTDQLARIRSLNEESYNPPDINGAQIKVQVKNNKLWVTATRRLNGLLHETGVAYLHIGNDGVTILNGSGHGREIDRIARVALMESLKPEKTASDRTPQVTAGQEPSQANEQPLTTPQSLSVADPTPAAPAAETKPAEPETKPAPTETVNPSLGPGAAAAKEFEERGPDPEVLGLSAGNPVYNRLQRQFQNLVAGVGQLFKRGLPKAEMEMLANRMVNYPSETGRQAGNDIRLRATVPERQAVVAIMQALSHPNPADRLRTVQTDMETLAQQRLAKGEKLEAQAAIDLANAARLGLSRFTTLRPLAEQVNNRLNRQFAREQANGIDTAYGEWYVPQRHDLDLLPAAGRPIILGDSGAPGPSSAFRKAKTFPDYAASIEAGRIPKSLDIADLLEHRVKQGESLIARKTFFNQLRRYTDPHDSQPLVTDIPKRRIERPDGTVEFQESIPLGYEAMQVVPGVRLAVHRGYAPLIDALTARSQLSQSPVIGTARDIAGDLKSLTLAIDTFHASRMLQRELFATGKVSLGERQRLGRALVEYSPASLEQAVHKGEITQDQADWIMQPQTMQIGGREVQLSPHAVARLGVESGLNLGRHADALVRDWIKDIPAVGKYFDSINKWVFEKQARSAIALTFLHEFQRVGKAFPELSAKEVGFKTAKDVNVLFGNIQKENWFKNPSLNTLLDIVFLAPRWVQSLARSEGRAALQLGQSGVDLAKGRGLRIGTAGKTVGNGLAAYLLGTQLLNLATRRQLTWQNEEEGHKLDAWIPDLTGSNPRGFFISPLSVFAELTHDLLRYSRQKPDIASAVTQIIDNKLGPMGRSLEVLGSGRDPLSNEKLIGTWRRISKSAQQLAPVPIIASQPLRAAAAAVAPGMVDPPAPGAVQRQVTSSLGFKTEVAPSPGQQVRDLAQRWALNQTGPVRDAAERRLQEEFPASSYSNLRGALSRGDDKAARTAYNDLRAEGKTPKTIRQTIEHPHPFTGSASSETRFRQSLNPQQLDLYERATEERKELARRYRTMLAQ